MILICIFLIVNNFEHFPMNLLAIHISFMKHLAKSFFPFKKKGDCLIGFLKNICFGFELSDTCVLNTFS